MGKITEAILNTVTCQKCRRRIKEFEYSGYPRTCVDCVFPGYAYLSWDNLKKGDQVWLYGFHDKKPKLYGPHVVHNPETHELKNPRLDRTFYNNKNIMVTKL